MKKYYFTFGNSSEFPYQDTYIVVVADTEKDAVAKFRERFPDRHEGTVNCSFWYSEEEWADSLSKAQYEDPAETIA